ncbi:unnamed protein product [Lymnaea stagnalis]|uniref:Major facilitator superfamily (MFS) profile domain-containing protein n=1 Tax=Lymnaea stagnalis TaxID=6523 RepID=A0AAV2GWL5_LYMST
MKKVETFEDILEELGGMGKFQWLVTICIASAQFTMGWSMLQMSFASMVPDYTCIVGEGGNDTTFNDTDTLNVCEVNGTECSRYLFHGSVNTVSSEWGLICDLRWIKATVTSIQMGGVFLGALISGQISDLVGRRKTLYSFVLAHIIFNLIAAFSTSWVMFAVMRFFIGTGIGSIVAVVFPYTMEFLPMKWRPLLSILPSWTVGVAFFSAAALLLKDWSYLHIACAVCSIPSAAAFFFVPDSIRWLAVHGRIQEAEAVFGRIARMNSKPLPVETLLVLDEIARKEKELRKSGRQYSYIDIFRGFRMTQASLSLFFFWFTMSSIFYGISFGVSSLSGNMYLNICLLGILELPAQTSTFFISNKIGRRRSSFLFFGLSTLISLGCIVAHHTASDDSRGAWINGLSLTEKMMIGAVWSCVQTWGSELYPTVTRNLGYSFSNLGARFGGILAPFIINLDKEMASTSYIIMTSILAFSSLLVIFLPETRGLVLMDSIDFNSNARQADDADRDDLLNCNGKVPPLQNVEALPRDKLIHNSHLNI